MDRLEDGVGRPGRAEKLVMQPAGCRAYIRRRLAKEFPGIVDGFLKEAKSGSVPHLKLATELLKPVRKGTSRKKSETMRALDKMMKTRLPKSAGPGESQGDAE